MADWIVNTVEALGYVGIAVLMFIENVFPPIPSELIMPLAGFTAARGDVTLVGAIIAGTIGSLAGQFPLYYMGYFFGEERLKRLADRYGKWFTVSREDIDR
ncbi:MAG: DedA family protein, partial [Planctomycetota bacterium]